MMADKNEWYAEGKEIVPGVVALQKKGHGKDGTGFGSDWSIDLDELARITNGHPEFMEKVKEFIEKDGKNIYNAVAYRSFAKGDRQKEQISLVCDVIDSHIKLISCSHDHAEGHSYVLDTSYNKSYVWQMASML